MRIFVTGFHGAGTRSAGRHFAEKKGVKYITEGDVKLSPDRLTALNNFSCQCPRMAHHSKQLSRYGKVYWMTRNHYDLIKTVVGMNTGSEGWKMMRGFREMLPDDPVWDLVQYDGSEDVYHGYAGYFTLFVKIKDYLMRKHYLPYITVLEAEKMEYWDTPTERSLTVKQQEFHERYLDEWNRVKELL